MSDARSWQVGAMMAYEGAEGCTSMYCRQFFGPDNKPSGTHCLGWHCAVCDEPSNQYGHSECRETEEATR